MAIVVKPRSRLLHGHDWVMKHEVARVQGEPAPGDVIMLKDPKMRPLGSAIYNPNSNIVARRFCRRRQKLDADFFQRRINQATAHRAKIPGEPDALRMVWSESDGLPGLIVDRFKDCLVVQTLTLAMDLRLELILDTLGELFSPRAIVERNDTPSRTLEGMEPRTGVVRGELPPALEVRIGGVDFQIDLLHGQKTGFYLDQAANYPLVAAEASGARVLDCFSNEGAFALACAKAGAASVTAVESSAHHAERARQNAERLGLRIDMVQQNAFDFLKNADRQKAAYDLIILDPPSFTRSRSRQADALRGYKEIHLRAAGLLDRGGRLMTFCCSHHIHGHEFEEVIRDALGDAKKSARLIRRFGQSPDHPVLLHLPESEYLKGLDLEIISAR